MQLRRSLALLASAALVLSGCGQGSSDSETIVESLDIPPAVEELYEAAQEEGTVSYWQSEKSVEMAQVLEIFTARFPGVKVEPVTIQPQEGVEKVVSEARASDSPVDVLQLNPAYAAPLVERGLVMTPDWSGELGIPAEEVYANGALVVDSHLPVAFTYNPSLIDREDLPKTWDDLADSQLAGGKLAIDARGFMFAYLALDRGRDAAVALLESVLANDPLPLKGAFPIAQAVSTGEASVAVGPYISTVESDKSRGATIEWAPPEDVMPVIVYGNVVVKAASNPNGAQLLTWWLNSEEGVRAREEAGLHPQRLTGGYIPEASQEVLDSGVKLIFDATDPEGQALLVEMFAEMSAKIGGLS